MSISFQNNSTTPNGAVQDCPISSHGTDGSLNLTGQLVTAGGASLAVNYGVHWMCTAKNWKMSGIDVPQHVKAIQKTHGVLGVVKAVYGGVLPAIGMDVAGFGLSFVTNDALRASLGPWGASASAGGVAVPIMSGGEKMMINKQVNNMGYVESFKKALHPAEMGVTLVRDVPYNIAVFGAAPELRKIFENIIPSAPPMALDASAGFVAGAGAGYLTTPADIVKTQMQASQEPTTPLKTMQKIKVKGGPKAFLAGGRQRAIYVGSASALQHTANTTIPALLPSVFKKKSSPSDAPVPKAKATPAPVVIKSFEPMEALSWYMEHSSGA